MKGKLFMGMGAAFAALISVSGGARAQDTTQTFNQNNTNFSRSESYERIDNRGIPHQAPSLGLGNIYGLNPCATGVSVGVTTPLVGVGGAFSTIDSECQLRNNAAIAVSALKDESAAREIMCEVEVFRKAAMRIGRPCIIDGGVPLALRAGSTVDTASAASLAPLPPSNRGLPPDVLPPIAGQQPNPAPTNGSSRQLVPGVDQLPALCSTPGLVLRLYPECSGNPAERHSAAPQDRPATATQAPETARRHVARPTTPETTDPSRRVERPIDRSPTMDSAALASRIFQAQTEATNARLVASAPAANLRRLALRSMD